MQGFIVISNPLPLKDEADHINGLFDAGMPLFHLRKPGYGTATLKRLLEAIRPEYYDRVALHQHHELARDFDIKRLHFPETERLHTATDTFRELHAAGNILSTSVHHQVQDIKLPDVFAYTFSGPFAESISKPGYGPAQAVTTIEKRSEGTKIFALGGISKSNLLHPLAAGFDGVAVLGSIWKDKNSIDNFKQLRDIWLTKDLA